MSVPRVALVGVGGYGRVHLQHLLDFHARGELQFVATVIYPPEPDPAIGRSLAAIGCEIFSSFEALQAALPRLQLDLGVLPTPIHLHARMTIALLEAGLHVLVEKPITATLAETEAIAAAARRTGRRVAVGFQYLHAPEIVALKQRLLGGEIGALQRLVVHAAWPRGHSYYTRNAWAGRLRVGEDWVLDSPVNNAMSHFLMLMLFLAGRDGEAAAPTHLAAELYRAQAIESFDTGVLRLRTRGGVHLDFYGTHSSREIGRPSLRLTGTLGRGEWIQDSQASLEGLAGRWVQAAGPESSTREVMLRDVLGRLRGGDNFICTPELAAAHVRCVATLHARVPIVPVAPAYLVHERREQGEFTYIPGLDEQLTTAATQGISLAAAGAKWAQPPQATTL